MGSLHEKTILTVLKTIKIVSTILFLILISGCSAIKETSRSVCSHTSQEQTLENGALGIIYTFFKDFSGTIIAIIGLFIGIPILRRKLLEQHITKALADIQDTNKSILIESTRLIDEYLIRTYSSEPIKLDELKVVSERVKNLYHNSQGGSSECQTLLYYLKVTLQNTYKHYGTDEDHFQVITSFELYKLVIDTLQWVNFFATQVVHVPKSAKTENIKLFKEEISKNISDWKFIQYKHFKQGYINDPNSGLYLAYMNEIHICMNTLIKRSAFQIYQNNEILGSFLQSRKMYAPLKLDFHPTHENRSRSELFLIGYKVYEFGGRTKDTIKLLYANPSENFEFIQRYIENHEIQNLKDSFIIRSGFDISKQITTPKYYHLETVLIEFEVDYLKKQFEKNGKELKRRLKRRKSLYSKVIILLKRIF